MRKRGKIIIALLALAAALAFTAACGGSRTQNEEEYELSMESVYQLAVEKGYTGTLEELIEAFRGEPGPKGDSGAAGPKGETGPAGPKGDPGEAGKSAYEIYLAYHPEYTGSEEQWLNDLVSGNLGQSRRHTVSFNTYGGSQIPAQSVPHGDKVLQPEDPTKPGYDFVGWTTDGHEWVFYGYSVTEDMVFDATWKIQKAPGVFFEAQAFSDYALVHVRKDDPYGVLKLNQISYRKKYGGNYVGDPVVIEITDQDRTLYRVEGLSPAFVYDFSLGYEYDADGDGIREKTAGASDTTFPEYGCPDITVGEASVTDGIVSFEIEMRGYPESVTNFNVYLRKGGTEIEKLELAGSLVQEGNVYRVSGSFTTEIDDPSAYNVWISCDYKYNSGPSIVSNWFTYTIFFD